MGLEGGISASKNRKIAGTAWVLSCISNSTYVWAEPATAATSAMYGNTKLGGFSIFKLLSSLKVKYNHIDYGSTYISI